MSQRRGEVRRKRNLVLSKWKSPSTEDRRCVAVREGGVLGAHVLERRRRKKKRRRCR